jgi:hypothetical protein
VILTNLYQLKEDKYSKYLQHLISNFNSKIFCYFQLQLGSLVYLCSSVQFVRRHLLDQIDHQKHYLLVLQLVEVFGSVQQINYFASLDYQLIKYSYAYPKSYWLNDFMQQICGCYHDRHCWSSCFLRNWGLFLGYSLKSNLFCYVMKLLEFYNYIPNQKIYNNLDYLHFINYSINLLSSLKYLCFILD